MVNRPGQYIYSYDYELNENWGNPANEEVTERAVSFLCRKDVLDEIDATVGSISESTEGKLIFTLLSDSHYVTNGNWEYTSATIKAVNDRIREEIGRGPDGTIHLGDFTDGILSRDICKDYSHRIIDDIKAWGSPLYIALGNHDANYFRGNPEVMDEDMQYQMYLEELGISGGKLWYRADIEGKNLTFLVLSAYDNNEKNRYGYSLEQINWLKGELDSIDDNNRVIILSHDAPLSYLDYWASEIRNGDSLCDCIDEWNLSHNHRVIAFLHGYTHADYVCTDRSFPIISVGCSKIEYFEEKRPEGAVTPVRYEDEVTQELWDTMIVDVETGTLDFIRFGAGMDRHIEGMIGCNSDDKTSRSSMKLPKIWGHRGASGYAPENTLEAFELAYKLGAEGIELDVQFTRDRQLVVIHDERIDRTSDGTGFVADYTLDEIRKFNFNKTNPQYDHCNIPTLEEVLQLVKPTGMVINIELKTSVNYYPGIEREVVELVNKYEMMDRIIFSSFNHESVLRVKDYAPEAVCGLLYSEGIADQAGYAKRLGVEAIHPYTKSLRYPDVIDNARHNGIKIHTWTANSDDEIKRMLQYGVDAIITNYPDKAREIYYGTKVDTGEAGLINSIYDRMINPDKYPVETKKKGGILHLCGTMYKYIRRPFVAIDRVVQRAAGK